MAELPVYATDTAICRLLAAGPLPSAAIAARLAMSERTARHRLRQLRRSGIVITGTNGIHHLAGALPGPASTGAGPVAAPVTGTPEVIAPGGKETDGVNGGPTLPGGYWTVLVVLAVAGIAVVAVSIRRRPPDPPAPLVDPGTWGPWTAW